MRKYALLFIAVCSLSTATDTWALEYGFSGLTTPFTGGLQVSGTLTLSSPSVYSDLRVDYDIAYTMLIGTQTFAGSGLMRLQDGAVGLFDGTFRNRIYNEAGQLHHWEANDGRFFFQDGSAYPAMVESVPTEYAVAPWRISFIGSAVRDGPTSPLHFSYLTAQQVPEPSTFATLAIGLLFLSGWKSRQYKLRPDR